MKPDSGATPLTRRLLRQVFSLRGMMVFIASIALSLAASGKVTFYPAPAVAEVELPDNTSANFIPSTSPADIGGVTLTRIPGTLICKLERTSWSPRDDAAIVDRVVKAFIASRSTIGPIDVLSPARAGGGWRWEPLGRFVLLVVAIEVVLLLAIHAVSQLVLLSRRGIKAPSLVTD